MKCTVILGDDSRLTPGILRRAVQEVTAGNGVCYARFFTPGTTDEPTLRRLGLLPVLSERCTRAQQTEPEFVLRDHAEYLQRIIKTAAQGGCKTVILDRVLDAVAAGRMYGGLLAELAEDEAAAPEILLTGDRLPEALTGRFN